MAIASVGSIASGSDKSSGSSWSSAALLTAALEAGNLIVVVLATDNISGSTGETNDHTGVTLGGTPMDKAAEYTNSGGSCVSIWYYRPASTLSSGSDLAATFSASVTAKAITAWEFTVGADVVVDDYDFLATTSNGQTVDLAGLDSKERLSVRGVACEATVGTITPDSNFAALTPAGTSGQGATSNQGVMGEWDIDTATGVSTSAADNRGNGVDRAILLVSFVESGPSEVTGTAALSSSGSLVGIGEREVFAVGGLSSSDSLVAAGLRGVLGAAALPVADQLLVVGTIPVNEVFGTAALLSSGALVAAGLREVVGASVLDGGAASLSAAALREVFGASAPLGGGALSVSAFRERFGSAALSSSDALMVTGLREVFGAAGLSSAGGLSDQGLRTVLALASLPASDELLVVGTVTDGGDSLLPDLHVPNVGLTYYVDAVNGSDSNGGTDPDTDAWQTLAKAYTYLRDTATWPTDQDIRVYIREGTYQAASGSAATLDPQFNQATRKPTSTQWVIWEAYPGDARPVIKPPSGSSGAKYGVRTTTSGTSFIGDYQQWIGLEFDGEQTIRGDGDVAGLYFSGTSKFNEVIDCIVHGMRANYVANGGAAARKAQGIYCDPTTEDIRLTRVHIYDIGDNAGTINAQEHGVYYGGARLSIWNSLIENIPNGFGLQFYDNNNVFEDCLVANVTFRGPFEKSCIIVHPNSTGMVFKNLILDGASEYGFEFYPGSASTGSGNVIDSVLYNGLGIGNREEASPTGWTITNEQTADPLFVDSSDDHLQSGSPAYDVGDLAYTPLVDLDGVTRVAATLGAYAAPEEIPGGVVFGVAALEGGGVLVVAGLREVLGLGTVTSADALVASGRRTVGGAAALSATDALVASALREIFGVAGLSGSDVLASSGLRSVLGLAELQSLASLVAVGVIPSEVLAVAVFSAAAQLRAVGRAGPAGFQVRGESWQYSLRQRTATGFSWPMETVSGDIIFAVRQYVIQVPYERRVVDHHGMEWRVLDVGLVEPV